MSSSKREHKDSGIVVFEILRNSSCAECGEQLGKGRWLRLEEKQPLCLECADLAHLVFLPAGNTALTRRASKHSKLRAVLVRFSRSRKHYERQGILVEEAAIAKAEQECLADEDARARARERRAKLEAKLDKQFRNEFAERVKNLYPGCPPAEAKAIAEHACLKHSGRVGRTAAAKEFSPEAIDLAVRARVRHVHTRYDELLGRECERHEARAEVREETEKIMNDWRSPATKR